jgi:hypothetical protein
VFENLSRKELLKILDMYAKAWQAMDGAYFLSLERRYGIDVAIEIDKEAWSVFSPIEASRIMKDMGIPANGGLRALEKALGYRVYAALNKQSIEWKGNRKFAFTMDSCRVQAARSRKGLPDFPCKQVGMVEYEEFAKTIDPRIKTRCILCPPDTHPANAYCSWEFSVEE